MIYPELLPTSPGAQLQKITVRTSSIQLGQRRFQFPIESFSFLCFSDPIGDCNNRI